MRERGRAGAAAFALTMLVLMSLYPAVESGLRETGVTTHATSRSTVCTGVCINEVMPNADGSDQGVFPNGEWVELYNSGSTETNLQNWTLEDVGGWVHPIDSSTWVGFSNLDESYVIASGDYAIIAENEVGTLRLNNGGETLYLKDASGAIVHTVTTGEASNGVSKIPATDSSADWVDSEENTPGAANSEGSGGGEEVGGTPSDLTRVMMMPSGAEVTGLHVNSLGNLFVNAMHPDDDYYDATVGVVNGVDWNALPGVVPELDLSSSEWDVWHGIRVSHGDYQVLVQSGDALSEGGVAGGIYAADDGELLFTSQKPDFNAFVPLNPQGTRGYLYTTWESRPAGVSQLLIEWNSASQEWDVMGGLMQDLSEMNGGWVLCFGSISPWGNPLLSEELYFADTVDWNNPDYQYHSDQQELADYLGHYPNPYDYGWIVEIEDADTASPTFDKQFAMGRFSHENAQVMPDEKTVYLSDDEYGTVLFKFIADTAGNLESGTLYAARLSQDSGSDPATTGFDVEWVELASSSDAEIGDWIDEYDGITPSDFVSGQNSYISDQEINDWAESVLDDDLDGDGDVGTAADDRVAFL